MELVSKVQTNFISKIETCDVYGIYFTYNQNESATISLQLWKAARQFDTDKELIRGAKTIEPAVDPKQLIPMLQVASNLSAIKAMSDYVVAIKEEEQTKFN